MTAFHPRCEWRGAVAAVALAAVFLFPGLARPAGAERGEGGGSGRGTGLRIKLMESISTKERGGEGALPLEGRYGKVRLEVFTAISEESMGIAGMLAPDEELVPLVRISPRVLKRKRVVVKVWKPWARDLMYNLSWGGNVYDNYNKQTWQGGNGFERNMAGLRLEVNSRTFIWRPWLATVDGGIGLFASHTAGQNISTYTANSIFGDIGLAVFPYSRFPFQASYSRTRTDQGGDLRDITTETERYSLRQSYRTLGGASFSGGYLYTDVKTESLSPGADNGLYTTRSVLDTFDFNASKSIDNHSLGLNSTLNKSRRVDIARNYDTLSVAGRHRYAPGSAFSLENEVNYYNYYERAVTGYVAGGDEFSWDQDIYQLASNAYWRPEDKPVTANAGLRLYGSAIERSSSRGGSSPSNQLANGSVYAGVNYSVSKNTYIYGTANYVQPLEFPWGAYTSSQSAGVIYSSDQIDFLKMKYTWSNQLGANNNMAERNNTLRLMETIRHGLQKDFNAGENSLFSFSVDEAFSIDHYVNAAHGGYAVPEPQTRETITHSASVSWTTSGEWGRGSVRLSGSDNRNRGVMEGRDEIASQFAYFQASLDSRLSKYSLVYADWVTQYSDSNLSGARAEKSKVRSRGIAQYRNDRFAGIPGLTFQTSFRIDGRAYLPEFRTDKESSETMSWTNNLDYSIGRFQAAAMYAIVMTAAGQRDILMLRISRSFGN